MEVKRNKQFKRKWNNVKRLVGCKKIDQKIKDYSNRLKLLNKSKENVDSSRSISSRPVQLNKTQPSMNMLLENVQGSPSKKTVKMTDILNNTFTSVKKQKAQFFEKINRLNLSKIQTAQKLDDHNSTTFRRNKRMKKLTLKHFAPWGVDQQRLKGDKQVMSFAKIQKQNKQKLRERARSSGKARIGLDVLYQIKQELKDTNLFKRHHSKKKSIQNKSQSSPKMQRYISKKQKLHKQLKQIDLIQKQKDEDERLLRLKKLDIFVQQQRLKNQITKPNSLTKALQIETDFYPYEPPLNLLIPESKSKDSLSVIPNLSSQSSYTQISSLDLQVQAAIVIQRHFRKWLEDRKSESYSSEDQEVEMILNSQNETQSILKQLQTQDIQDFTNIAQHYAPQSDEIIQAFQQITERRYEVLEELFNNVPIENQEDYFESPQFAYNKFNFQEEKQIIVLSPLTFDDSEHVLNASFGNSNEFFSPSAVRNYEIIEKVCCDIETHSRLIDLSQDLPRMNLFMDEYSPKRVLFQQESESEEENIIEESQNVARISLQSLIDQSIQSQSQSLSLPPLNLDEIQRPYDGQLTASVEPGIMTDQFSIRQQINKITVHIRQQDDTIQNQLDHPVQIDFLTILKGIRTNDLEFPDKKISVQMFDLDLIQQNLDNQARLQDQTRQIIFQADRIHNQMLFDCFIHSLSQFQHKKSFPWSCNIQQKLQKIDLDIIYQKVTNQMIEWTKASAGKVPDLDYILFNGVVDHEKLQFIREDKLSILLAVELIEEDYKWIDYSNEEAQVAIDLGDIIAESLIDEVINLLNNRL